MDPQQSRANQPVTKAHGKSAPPRTKAVKWMVSMLRTVPGIGLITVAMDGRREREDRRVEDEAYERLVRLLEAQPKYAGLGVSYAVRRTRRTLVAQGMLMAAGVLLFAIDREAANISLFLFTWVAQIALEVAIAYECRTWMNRMLRARVEE